MCLLIGGCAGSNQLKIVELGSSGMLNPFVPTVIRGCLADAGDNDNVTITYNDGKCNVTATIKGEQSGE